MDYCAGLYRISIHAPHARSDHECNFYDRAHGYFNPRSSCEERRLRSRSGYLRRHFNPRSSCEERPPGKLLECADLPISIHAPHARSDDVVLARLEAGYDFNPRSSCEERLGHWLGFFDPLEISIHAPHARSDVDFLDVRWFIIISIHAPHARSDSSRIASALASGIFQSTLLMRGATCRSRSAARRSTQNFNPRSSCEERPSSPHSSRAALTISIHAPHARSDSRQATSSTSSKKFQSTLLMRGATGEILFVVLQKSDFNPRSSCEERL